MAFIVCYFAGGRFDVSATPIASISATLAPLSRILSKVPEVSSTVKFNPLVYWGYLWASPNTLLAIAIGWMLGGRFSRVDGVLEIHGPRVAAVLSRLVIPAAALTMGHVVFGRDVRALEMTRRHERVHVRQYATWGPFFLPAYLGISLYFYATGRDGYRANPFEIEAYAVEETGEPERR